MHKLMYVLVGGVLDNAEEGLPMDAQSGNTFDAFEEFMSGTSCRMSQFLYILISI